MGKCASKDIINGQIVPNAELDAGSPMFAPEAPTTVGAETHTDAGAGAEVTFQGFSPAPVEPVAAALPQPRGVSVDGPMAGNQYSHAYPVQPAGGPLDGKLFMSLEEAEAAARKQNEAWGVAHIPYDPNTNNNGPSSANYEQPPNFGQSYADAFPPSQQHPVEPRPAEPTSADEHQAARPAYHEQHPVAYHEAAPVHAADPHQQASGYQPASPERPSVGGQSYGGVHESLPPAHNAYPPVVAEQQQHASPEAAPVAAPVAEPVAAEPAIQTVSVPEAAPAPAEDAAVVPATDSKKKKKKSSKKSKNWAWF